MAGVEITNPISAEAALSAEHAESELFINSVPSILIGTDARGMVTRWNLAAANTFGFALAAVCDKCRTQCGIKWTSPNISEEIDSWCHLSEGGKRVDLLFKGDGAQHFLGLTIKPVTFANQKRVGLREQISRNADALKMRPGSSVPRPEPLALQPEPPPNSENEDDHA
jgi:PAS domain-containing protein